MITAITYLLHVQMMPAGHKNQLEARFCRFLLGTNQGRVALSSPILYGGACVPQIDLWQQSLDLKIGRRLSTGTNIWGAWLGPLCRPPDTRFFKIWLTDLRKPRDIKEIISPRIDLDMWPTTQSLLIGLDETALKACLRCSIAPGSNLKVKNLKFKLSI